VNHLAALGPGSTFDSKNSLDIFGCQKIVSWREIIAKRWFFALLSNVINIEFRSEWVAKNGLNINKLAIFDSKFPDTGLDKGLASFGGWLEDFFLHFADQLVLIGEIYISWILEVWINKAISDSHSLEVNFEVILVLEVEVVGNSWNVVTSVALTSDVEVRALKLWIFLKEFNHELGHILSNFVFIADKISDARV
jgi:hypothetical protein